MADADTYTCSRASQSADDIAASRLSRTVLSSVSCSLQYYCTLTTPQSRALLHPSPYQRSVVAHLSTMAAIDEGLIRFKHILSKECKLDDTVVTYMTDEMKLTSVSDFAGTFTKDTFAEMCKINIIDKIDSLTESTSSTAQCARVRNAWEICRAELDASLKRKINSASSDLDEPLDDLMRKEIGSNFEKIYAFKIPEELTPSATLMGRLYRELKSVTISVHDLTKVKTAVVNDAIIPKKRKIFGDMMMTMKGDEDDIHSPIGSPLQVILALTTLLNGYALCGTTQVDSKRTSNKVRIAAYGDMMRYLSFVSQQANSHPGPPSKTTSWLLDRDTRTRSAARSLVLEGWPLGEALIDVMEKKMAVLWEVDGIADVPNASQRMAQSLNYGHDVSMFAIHDGQMATRPTSAAAAGQFRQPPQADHQLRQQAGRTQELCVPFNDHRGCTLKQRDCPTGGLHRCNNKLADGSVCNAWQHNRKNCTGTRSSGTPPTSPTKEKGRGKGKGKGH